MIPTLNAVTSGGSLSLPEFIALAKRHAFSAVEFSILKAKRFHDETDFDAVSAAFDGNKILPAAFGLPVQWRRDKDTFRSDLADLQELAHLARGLGCSRCTTYVLAQNGEPAGEYSARSVERLAQAGKILEDEGVRLGLEFIGPQHLREDPEQVWFYEIHGALDAVRQVEERGELENIGLLVDSFHWYTSGGTMMDLASIPIEMFVHVHINDAPRKPREEQLDNERLLPGETGVIDLQGFLGTLNALGYDGPLAVETFSKELDALDPDQSAARAAAAVAGVLNAAGITPVRLV